MESDKTITALNNYLPEKITIAWIDDDFANENSDLFAVGLYIKRKIRELGKNVDIIPISTYKKYEEIKKTIPDIIILDMNLKNMNISQNEKRYLYYSTIKGKEGFQIFKEINITDNLMNVPKIIFTVYSKEEAIGKLDLDNNPLLKYICKKNNKQNVDLYNAIIELLGSIPFSLEMSPADEKKKQKFLYSLKLIDRKAKKDREKYLLNYKDNIYTISKKQTTNGEPRTTDSKEQRTANGEQRIENGEKTIIKFEIPHQIDGTNINIWFNELNEKIDKEDFKIFESNDNYKYIDTAANGKQRTANEKVWAAATPITAYNPEGSSLKDIFDNYYNKLFALSKMGFGRIVLKTVYKEENEKNITREEDTIYSNVRGFSSFESNNLNIYNTGKTMKENISPEELKKFIDEHIKDVKINNSKIIISIGSHSDKEEIWKNLLNMFKDAKIELIEINTRHVFRHITKKYTTNHDNDAWKPSLIGLDEYLISPDSNEVWGKMKEWMENINNHAIKIKKKLILKLPFRSDLNIIANIINNIYLEKKEEEKKYGIWGVSLINTIKSPYKCMREGDFTNIPQYSGEDLGFLRNMALYTVKNILNKGIRIIAIGGVIDKEDVDESFALGAYAVQLSTIALINLKKTQEIIESEYTTNNGLVSLYEKYRQTRNIKRFVVYKAHWDGYKCINCGKCVRTAYCDAIVNKFANSKIVKDNYYVPTTYPIINKELCLGCGICAGVCGKQHAITLKPEEAEITGECPICKNKFTTKNKPYLGVKFVNDVGKNYYCKNCDSLIIEDERKLYPLYINGMNREKKLSINEFKKTKNDYEKIYDKHTSYLSYIKLDYGDINMDEYNIEFGKNTNGMKAEKNGNIYLSAYKEDNNKAGITICIKKKSVWT